MKEFRKTKIVATIGPATSSKTNLKKIIQAGVNVCRLNFSHGSHEDHAKVIKSIKEINKELHVHTAILADLQGPKIRIGDVENNKVELVKGKTITITTKKCIGTQDKVYITYPEFPADVSAGEKVLMDDGKLILEVVKTNGKDMVEVKILHGGILSSKKGVNLPNTKISLPCLTKKDKEDLDFVLEHNIEWIGLSFVRSPKDIIQLRKLIEKKGHSAKIIAKIEKPEAVKSINEIIRETDGLMVARGDLGVEVPFEDVPTIQKMIVKRARSFSKPVIIATQMMESMMNNLTPSRAEVNDVANAVLDGADAVMLSGETSVGNFPVEVVQTMAKIARKVESYEDIYHREVIGEIKADRFISDAICTTACDLVKTTGAVAITTMTMSGYTAYKISSFRPRAGIFVFTSNHSILNTLSLVWGVRGFYYNRLVSTDETISDIKEILKQEKYVSGKDLIINIASMPITEKGKSNMLKLSSAED